MNLNFNFNWKNDPHALFWCDFFSDENLNLKSEREICTDFCEWCEDHSIDPDDILYGSVTEKLTSIITCTINDIINKYDMLDNEYQFKNKLTDIYHTVENLIDENEIYLDFDMNKFIKRLNATFNLTIKEKNFKAFKSLIVNNICYDVY